MLPFFLRHYAWADKIILFDNGSTDDTLEIAKRDLKVEVRTWLTPNVRDDMITDLKNTAYKSVETDWVIVADVDEHLWHPNGLRQYLEQCMAKGITIPRVEGRQMVSEEAPADDGVATFTDLVKRGVRENTYYAKYAVFQKCVDIRYAAGCHCCNPSGRVSGTAEAEVLLLHYKWVGFKRALERARLCASRRSDVNKANRWGYDESEMTEARWRPQFDEWLRQAEQVVP
jgi:glycosyltransferase involved in cell wall biosynthesis